MTVLGASVSPPLDPDRVGELPSCITTLRRVKRVINEYIDNMKALQQKELSDIFTDASVLEDHSSQWYGFTHERIATRVGWLEDILIPAIDRDVGKMELLLHRFLDYCDRETGARISDEGKARIRNVTKVWETIEWSLQNQNSKGPYRVEAFAECKSLLDSLLGEIRTMGRVANTWLKKSVHIHSLTAVWFEKESTAYSLEIPTTRASSPSSSDSQKSLSDSPNRDIEKGCQEHQNPYSTPHKFLQRETWIQKRCSKGFLFKEFWLVTACFITAVIYTAVKHDAQTGFTIAGVLVASGNILLFAIAYKNKSRKIALE